jgi:hypothetical protein
VVFSNGNSWETMIGDDCDLMRSGDIWGTITVSLGKTTALMSTADNARIIMNKKAPMSLRIRLCIIHQIH